MPLSSLVMNNRFVDCVLNKKFDSEGDDDLYLAQVISDLFHDFFQLNAARRRYVTKNIMDQTFTVSQLHQQCEAVNAQDVSAVQPRVDGPFGHWAVRPLPCPERQAAGEGGDVDST